MPGMGEIKQNGPPGGDAIAACAGDAQTIIWVAGPLPRQPKSSLASRLTTSESFNHTSPRPAFQSGIRQQARLHRHPGSGTRCKRAMPWPIDADPGRTRSHLRVCRLDPARSIPCQAHEHAIGRCSQRRTKPCLSGCYFQRLEQCAGFRVGRAIDALCILSHLA